MTRVLSDLSSQLNRSLEKININKQAPEKSKNNQLTHLKQIIKDRDEEIARLKKLAPVIKHEVNYQRTALTTESDYDPAEQQQIKYLRLPSFGCFINEERDELQTIKNKYSQSCVIIAQLQAKLKMTISSSKNTEQELKNQIEILREDLRYLKEQHERANDSLRIQMQHRQSQRIKLVQNKYRQQIGLLNEQIESLKRDNYEKGAEITRLAQKIKKERASNQTNCRFIQNKNNQLSAKLQHLCLQSKQEGRKREEALIAQFQEDLQALHKEQAGQIKILCDRIRMLKSLLQEKDMQLKQKSKSQNFSSTFPTEGQKQQIGQKQINLSTIDKYLKH